MSKSIGQRLLGGIWLVDGILELLPGTTQNFLPLIQNTAQGQPAWLHGLLLWGAQALAPHAVLWNDLLGLVEIGIGLLLLLRFHPRFALTASIGLSVPIWIWGQAFGGILTGNATDIGAMPLYILAALLVWPAHDTTVHGPTGQSDRADPRPASLLMRGRDHKRGEV